MIDKQAYEELVSKMEETNTTLVAVSKKQFNEAIEQLFSYGHRDFGENYVQELVDKQAVLSKEIRWHFIGHLQSNKIKYLAPFVHLIHSVDSFSLLQQINKEAEKVGRIIEVLLQVDIAEEPTKHGFDEKGLFDALEFYFHQKAQLQHVRIRGLMGMATFTDNTQQVQQEFKGLHNLHQHIKQSFFLTDQNFSICSMGMSGDYKMAIEAGSNLVRIGTLLFGQRLPS